MHPPYNYITEAEDRFTAAREELKKVNKTNDDIHLRIAEINAQMSIAASLRYLIGELRYQGHNYLQEMTRSLEVTSRELGEMNGKNFTY